MQHTQTSFRRAAAWVLAVLLSLVSFGVVTGLVRPAPSVAQDRTIIVQAHADASVFGRAPRRNFGTRPRLVVGAIRGGSRVYVTFTIPATDLIIDDATLMLHVVGHSGRINVRRVHPGWREHRITKVSAPHGKHPVGSIGRNRGRNAMGLDVTRLIDGSRTTLSFLLMSGGDRSILSSRQSARAPKIQIHGHTNSPSPSPTTTPSPTTSPGPTPSPSSSGGDTQPSLPIRAAFYYPWFPDTWGSSSNPFTNYHPSAGLYDSSDAGTIASHIDAMQYGGIQAGISSWWGQGSKTDQRMPALLRGADGTEFRWTVYYEPEAQGDPTVAQLQSDLTYLSNHYGSDPSFLRINGRFVVFVYADGSDACSMASRWAQANTVNAYIVLKVFSGFKTCADQPAGWHQYGPSSANADMSPYSYTISPGFWKKGETSPRLTRDPARWSNQVAAMASSNAQFQLVTTFNEWGEGTAVESASEWSSPSGYGSYLDILHGLPVSTSPAPTTSSTPTPTSTSPTPTSTSSSPPPASNPLVVIYMENKERSTVVGSTSATYQNALRAQGIDFTHYYGITHPSLPNYLALGNGATDGKQGTDSITAGELTQSPTLWNQLQNAGISWGVYEEDMPSSCSGATTSGLYALKHNPATPFASVFTNAAACSHVLPYTQFDVHAMPKVSFIAPNLCNDEHDCAISTGDAWLKANVAPMLANGATVVLTYDEGSTSAGINGTSGGGNIYMVVVGPGIGPSLDGGQYNHYSLLAAIEKRFGLTRLGGAASAIAMPI
ncbi:MAG: alkaline phosphatase family protein [Actinomycetota bacterium]